MLLYHQECVNPAKRVLGAHALLLPPTIPHGLVVGSL